MATQALAKAKTPTVITTPDEYTSSLRRWHEHQYHVLTPAITFSGLPPSHGMVAALVQINPDPAAGDVYVDPLFCKAGEVAIAKLGLSKLAQAAGMTIKTERTDPRTLPYYWEVRATARFIGLDGSPQELDATVEYDLRDGSPRIRNFKDKQIQSARAHGLRGAEARAINAVIRQFGIRQKYRQEELRKPFVTVRVTYTPDLSDPEVRRLVTERSLQGTTALYGPPKALPVEAEPIDEIGAVDTPADAAPVDPAGLIKDLTTTTLTNKKTGNTFTKWTVVDGQGEEHVTINRDFGATLERCAAERIPVEILSETNGYDEQEITAIEPLDTHEPTLPTVAGL